MNFTETKMRIIWSTMIRWARIKSNFWAFADKCTGERFYYLINKREESEKRSCRQMVALCDYILDNDMVTEFGAYFVVWEKYKFTNTIYGIEA